MIKDSFHKMNPLKLKKLLLTEHGVQVKMGNQSGQLWFLSWVERGSDGTLNHSGSLSQKRGDNRKKEKLQEYVLDIWPREIQHELSPSDMVPALSCFQDKIAVEHPSGKSRYKSAI